MSSLVLRNRKAFNHAGYINNRNLHRCQERRHHICTPVQFQPLFSSYPCRLYILIFFFRTVGNVAVQNPRPLKDRISLNKHQDPVFREDLFHLFEIRRGDFLVTRFCTAIRLTETLDLTIMAPRIPNKEEIKKLDIPSKVILKTMIVHTASAC